MFGTALLKMCVGIFSHSSPSCLCGLVLVFLLLFVGFFWERASSWDGARDFSFTAFSAVCATLSSLNYMAVSFLGSSSK